MSGLVLLIVGVVVFAITVYGVVMAGGTRAHSYRN